AGNAPEAEEHLRGPPLPARVDAGGASGGGRPPAVVDQHRHRGRGRGLAQSARPRPAARRGPVLARPGFLPSAGAPRTVDTPMITPDGHRGPPPGYVRLGPVDLPGLVHAEVLDEAEARGRSEEHTSELQSR